MTKLEKIRGYMRERGIDALLVYNELNQQYVTGFAFTDGVVLITDKSAHLLTDFRYLDMAKNDASPEFKIEIPKNRTAYISEVLVGETVKTIGLEGDFLSYDSYTEITEKFKGCSFVGAGDIFLRARETKDADEIEKMAAAQKITDAAFSHILTVITPNMTEIEVAAELEYFMRRNGADGFAFDTIAVSGDASSLPHGTPRNIKLRSGFLTMDYGARVGGYCSDMTRTVVIGRADEEMKKLYNTVLLAQCTALNFLRAGVDCAAADKVARDIIDKDFEGAFGHSLGHSVGLFIHEAPNLSSRSVGRILRGGEVVTVEPGIYLSGKYGCRIEDMVLITEDGIHNFTKSPKELIEIG